MKGTKGGQFPYYSGIPLLRYDPPTPQFFVIKVASSFRISIEIACTAVLCSGVFLLVGASVETKNNSLIIIKSFAG